MPAPGFRQPQPRRPRLQDPQPATAEGESSPQEPETVKLNPEQGPSQVGDDGSGSSGASTGASSPESTEPLERRQAKLRAFRQIIGLFLDGVGGLVNSRLALFEEDDTWQMTTEDRTSIATPAARLAARHVPLPVKPGEENDMADVVEAIAGVGRYVMRNLERRRDFKRALREERLGQQDGTEQTGRVPA